MELEEIISNCQNNNQKYYTILYNLYRTKMLRVIKKYINDLDTCEEILQESFIKMYMKINLYKTNGSFDSWLLTLTRNTTIDYIRKNKNESLILKELDENVYLPINPIEEKLHNEDLINKSNLIINSLDDLTPAYRNVFNMYVIQGYNHNEIAEILSISEGTSKSNLFRAKNKIKKILNNKFELN